MAEPAQEVKTPPPSKPKKSLLSGRNIVIILAVIAAVAAAATYQYVVSLSSQPESVFIHSATQKNFTRRTSIYTLDQSINPNHDIAAENRMYQEAARSAWSVWSSLDLMPTNPLVYEEPDTLYEPVPELKEERRYFHYHQLRISFLTTRLIRMEWSLNQTFCDSPTIVFSEREEYIADPNSPVPFVHIYEITPGRVLCLETLHVKIVYGSPDLEEFYYTRAPPLNAASISIEIKELQEIWTPDKEVDAKTNLLGTIRTLDRVDGKTPLEPGLLSTAGWSVVDDTNSPLLLKQDSGEYFSHWAKERDNTVQWYTDWYMFGYGRDYRACLTDFVKVAGKMALPPKYAFGIWWSRWWIYSDMELKNLVEDFHANGVPLDNLVIDMDWHITSYDKMNNGAVDKSGQPLGWTGYSWNYDLFPNPRSFLEWCHQIGLHATLNLHPAAGIQPHEHQYVEMANAMNIDPTTAMHVPFDIADKNFSEKYMKIVIHGLEEDDGIDFWWLDYQQVQITNITHLNPTIWLNYVFFNDMERTNRPYHQQQGQQLRGLIFHRWGGLGSHRYQIGFSGDTYITWRSLDFQIFFTFTAANVGFGFWSHDIGGFMANSPTHPELFTRWVQWGALSPIFRTHAWRQEFLERRIWKYPSYYFLAMREAIHLRYSMLPYLYTEARRAHDTGVAMHHPVYYDYPYDPRAYQYKTQGMFGESILIAPVTMAVSDKNLLYEKTVFLPGGDISEQALALSSAFDNYWVEWHSLTALKGGFVYERSIAIDENPIYIKAGSVIPMSPVTEKTRNMYQLDALNTMILTVFPGPVATNGTYNIYEDDGVTVGYKTDAKQFTFTPVTSHFLADKVSYRVDIARTEGNINPMDQSSAAAPSKYYIIRYVGVPPPDRVLINGKAVSKHTHTIAESPVEYQQWALNRHPDLEWLNETIGWQYDVARFTLEVKTPLLSRKEASQIDIEWSSSFNNAEEFKGALQLLQSGWVGKRNTVKRAIHYMERPADLEKMANDCLNINMLLNASPFSSWKQLLKQFDVDYKTFVNNFARYDADPAQAQLKVLVNNHLKDYSKF